MSRSWACSTGRTVRNHQDDFQNHTDHLLNAIGDFCQPVRPRRLHCRGPEQWCIDAQAPEAGAIAGVAGRLPNGRHLDEKSDRRAPRMVTLGLSVEGTTEERFVAIVLAPYLAARQIHITAIPMHGNVSLDRVRSELQKIAHSFDYVSTFYDFYGFTGKAPEDNRQTLQAKISQHAHQSIRSRLIPYIQMHEYEGLLFTSPDVMQEVLAPTNRAGSVGHWADAILASFAGNPEAINDSQQTAPSKRLHQYTNYRKTTHGPNIANLIGVEKLRRHCAGFDEWLTQLETLAARATP